MGELSRDDYGVVELMGGFDCIGVGRGGRDSRYLR